MPLSSECVCHAISQASPTASHHAAGVQLPGSQPVSLDATQLREAPIYLVALSLRQQQEEDDTSTPATTGAHNSSISNTSDGGSSDGAPAALAELGLRLAGLLSFPDTLTADAVRYTRAAAVSLVGLLEGRRGGGGFEGSQQEQAAKGGEGRNGVEAWAAQRRDGGGGGGADACRDGTASGADRGEWSDGGGALNKRLDKRTADAVGRSLAVLRKALARQQ